MTLVSPIVVQPLLPCSKKWDCKTPGGALGCRSLMQALISLSILSNAGVFLSLHARPCHLSGGGGRGVNSRAGGAAPALPVPLPWSGCAGTNSMCGVTQGTPSCLVAAGPCWLVPGRPFGLRRCRLHAGTASSGMAPARRGWDPGSTYPSPKSQCSGLRGFGWEGSCLVCSRLRRGLLWPSWCLQWLVPAPVEWRCWGKRGSIFIVGATAWQQLKD